MRYIYGEANMDNKLGFCCPEMDIWEANMMAGAYTPHPCRGSGNFQTLNTTDQCDSTGCDFNPYRTGATDFYGPTFWPGYGAIDTKRPFTIVT